MDSKTIPTLEELLPIPESYTVDDELTANDVENLTRTIGRINRFLAFTAQDMVRVQELGVKPLYLIDFSDIFSLVWPEESLSRYMEVVKFLFSSSKISFTLPLGAMMELFHRLRQKLSAQKTRRQDLDTLMSNPWYSALVQFYDTQSRTITPVNEVVQNSYRLLRELHGDTTRYSRLASLFDSGKLNYISDIFEPKDLRPDVAVFEEAYAQLSSRRAFRDDIVNYVDAHNYATAFALTDKLYWTTHQICYLVTSSPVPSKTFERIKWENDPQADMSPEFILRTALVRHPVQLLIQSYLEQTSDNPLRALSELRANLEGLQTELRAAVAHGDLSLLRYGLTLEKGRRSEYLSALKNFLSFYWQVLRPSAELASIDQSREINRRRLLGVDAPTSSATLEEHNAKADQQQASGDISIAGEINYREVIILSDKVIAETENEISQLAEKLQKAPREVLSDVDLQGLIVEPDQLTIEVTEDVETQSTEFTAIIKSASFNTSTILLCADRYQDFISFWWRTNTTFVEFIRAARFFVKSAKSYMQKNGMEMSSPKPRQFLGCYFYTNRGTFHVRSEYLPEELNAEALMQLIRKGDVVRFIRMGLDVGDIWYDFVPFGSIPQRAGILTHLDLALPIAQCVRQTSSVYAQHYLVEKAITEILSRPANSTNRH